MTAPTLLELITPLTEAQALQAMIDDLASEPNPFPVDSWEVDSVPQEFLQAFSDNLQKLSVQQANVAMSGYIDYAASPALRYTTGPRAGTSPWLDVLGQQFFNLPRAEAQSTIGSFKLTAATTPVTRAVNSVITVTDTQTPAHIYSVTLTETVTIQVAGTTVAGFLAASPGGDYNIGINSTLKLVTAIPGVTVTNPALGGSTTWITFAGANLETDASYAQRLKNRWAELSTGSPNGAWVNWCFKASAEVRTAIATPTGFGTEIVTVYGDRAPVSDDGLAAIGTYVSARIPDCMLLDPSSPQNAVGATVYLQSTLYGPAASRTAAIAAARAALKTLVTNTPIGGYPIEAGAPEGYGISNGFFEDAIIEATKSMGVTRAPVSVSNSGSGGPFVAGDDFLMPEVADVPVVAQYTSDSATPPSFVLAWANVG